MTNYKVVSFCVGDIAELEQKLKSLRDNCGEEVKTAINNTLRISGEMYQLLHNIDKALEKEGTGGLSI